MIFNDIYSNLKHWYKLEETTGINVDDAKGSSDGTSNRTINNLTNANGVINKCFNFTSTQIDRVTLPYLSDINFYGSWSISFWCKLASIPYGDATKYLFVYQGEETPISLWYNKTGANALLSFYFSNSYGGICNFSHSYNDTDWHFITLSADGVANSLKIYIDAVAHSVDGYTSTLQASEEVTLTFGEQWDGLIDNIQFWNKALSQAEVEWLYNERNFNVLTKYYQVKRYTDASGDAGVVVEKFETLVNPLVVHEDIGLLADGTYGYTLCSVDDDCGTSAESEMIHMTKGT